MNTLGSNGAGLDTSQITTYGLFDAVNTATGKIAWRIKTSYKALSGMVVAGDLLFFGRSTGEFDAVDARTGQTLWSYTAHLPGMGGANGSPAVYVRNGREYVVMAFGGNYRQREDTAAATLLLGDAMVAFALPRADAAGPNVVTAHPMLVPTGAPEMFPPATSAPPGAHVVTIKIHDVGYYPNLFTVQAGAKVAVHLVNTGISGAGFAVNLPTGPIGVEGGVDPGKDAYFVFTAPAQPGAYRIYGPTDDQYSGMVGTMIVTPAR